MALRPFHEYVQSFPGKLTVKITTFGKCMNGRDGVQGSITGEYGYHDLQVYLNNTLAKTGYDQATGIRFDIPGRTFVYITLPWRAATTEPYANAYTPKES